MDNKVTSLIINVGVVILAIVGVYLIITAMGNTATIDPETGQASADTSSVSSAVTFSLYIVYATIAAIAIFTVIAIISNPKRFIPTAIGIAVFGLLIFVAYLMVNVEKSGPITELPDATSQNIFWGDLGIKTTFVLVATAIGLIIVQGVRSAIGYFSK